MSDPSPDAVSDTAPVPVVPKIKDALIKDGTAIASLASKLASDALSLFTKAATVSQQLQAYLRRVRAAMIEAGFPDVTVNTPLNQIPFPDAALDGTLGGCTSLDLAAIMQALPGLDTIMNADIMTPAGNSGVPVREGFLNLSAAHR